VEHRVQVELVEHQVQEDLQEHLVQVGLQGLVVLTDNQRHFSIIKPKLHQQQETLDQLF
jgi:hypothetical protein